MQKNEYPKVFILVLTWNYIDLTLDCLQSLQKLNYPNYKIVMIDNASSDATVETVHKQCPEVIVLTNSENLGYSRGNNVGIRYAYKNGADYFLIMNNDTIIDPNALTELVKVAERSDDIGFVTGKSYFYDKPNIIQVIGKVEAPPSPYFPNVGQGEIDIGQYDQEKEFDYIDNVYVLVKKNVYEKIGGYDSDFFMYCSEIDWCARAKKKNIKIFYTPKAKLWHRVSASLGGKSTSYKNFLLRKFAILFYWRNFPTKKAWRYTFYNILDMIKSIPRYIFRLHFNYIWADISGFVTGVIMHLKTRKRNY